MTSKDMVGLRMSSNEIARLDAEARKRGLKRAALIRACIDEALVDPLQILEAASHGEFSSEFLHFLIRFDKSLGLLYDPGSAQVESYFGMLRNWLRDNPYHPNAHKRVRAVVALCCRPMLSELKGVLTQIEEIAEQDQYEREFDEFRNEISREAFGTPEEDTENDD